MPTFVALCPSSREYNEVNWSPRAQVGSSLQRCHLKAFLVSLHQLHSTTVALLGLHPVVLASPASWLVCCKWGFVFTASYPDLSEHLHKGCQTCHTASGLSCSLSSLWYCFLHGFPWMVLKYWQVLLLGEDASPAPLVKMQGQPLLVKMQAHPPWWRCKTSPSWWRCKLNPSWWRFKLSPSWWRCKPNPLGEEQGQTSWWRCKPSPLGKDASSAPVDHY